MLWGGKGGGLEGALWVAVCILERGENRRGISKLNWKMKKGEKRAFRKLEYKNCICIKNVKEEDE